MSTRVRFDPPAMIDAAGRLLTLSDELKAAASAARAVPLHGISPELAATARIVLSEAGCDLAAAQTTTDHESHALIARAAHALALDEDRGGRELDSPRLRRILERLGESGKEFLHHVAAPSPWDALGFANALRERGRSELKAMRGDLRLVHKKLKWAQKYWDEHPWVRRDFKSPKDLKRNVTRLRKSLTAMDDATKAADRLDLEHYIPKGMRKNPLLKHLPVTGDILNATVAAGEGESLPDIAAKTGFQHAGGAFGASLGATACAGESFVTAGLGVAACPVLVGGGAAIGDYVAGKAYDPVVKPVVHKVVDAGKKIYHFLGG